MAMNQELSIELPDPQPASRIAEPDDANCNPSALPGALRRVSRKVAASVPKPHVDTLPPRVARLRRGDVFRRSQFVKQLAIEKRRADRSRIPLSIAMFDFAEATADLAFDGLIDLLSARKRETDFIARLDDTQLAVLLPDTNAFGAQRFVDAITRDIGQSGFSTTVETYPDHLFECLKADHEPERAAGSFAADPDRGPGYGSAVKRIIDFVAACVGLIALSPLMIVVAFAIALDSPGPVLYKQVRLGRGGKPFRFYKFRSMYRDADERVHREYVTALIARDAQGRLKGAVQRPWSKLEHDPRITPVGRFLRKTCIDELPQLFNVVKGELSLVGPRPPLPYEAAAYESWHLRRVLEVKPGVTGLWQVEGRNLATFDDMVRMDLRYVRAWSLMLDLRILLKTVVLVLQTRGGG
jgi:lipopolysaccharide/colanic/teichoic acid biosynthesis glycosyltransferase